MTVYDTYHQDDGAPYLPVHHTRHQDLEHLEMTVYDTYHQDNSAPYSYN